MNVLEIMDRESSSRSEIYLYEEEGKWYAYDRSAELLKRSTDEAIQLGHQAYSFYGVMQDKVEVDLESLLVMNWFVALCSDNEMMLLKNG